MRGSPVLTALAVAVLMFARGNRENIVLAIVALSALPLATNAQQTFQPPTATELFALRSACAQLGQRVLNSPMTVLGVARGTMYTANTKYDPATNRCYVEIDSVGTGDYSGDVARMLWDGQTVHGLAIAHTGPHGGNYGIIFDPYQEGYDATVNYINQMMGR
jgi:hypothetical protein